MTAVSPDPNDSIAGVAETTAGARMVRRGRAVGTGITATAHTTDGWPVASAVLTVTDMTGQQVVRVDADAEGQLASEPLPAAVYTAIITAPGFDPQARTAVVTQSGSVALGVIPMGRLGGVDLPSAGTWTIDPVHSTINFTARHIGIASVRGRFTEFAGKIEVADPVERSAVSAVIQTVSIQTGNNMRDNHLRSGDFLNVEQHATMEYVGTRITSLGGEKWRVDGNLTLNGVTRPIPLEMTYLGVGGDPWGGTRAAFHAAAELRRKDFDITYNQALGIGVVIGTTVLVELDIEAVRGTTLPVL